VRIERLLLNVVIQKFGVTRARADRTFATLTQIVRFRFFPHNEIIKGRFDLRLLRLDTIPARIIDCTALQAELAEIDENLIRNELTALDKGLQMARRKAIYLELYPETKAGVAQANGANKAQGKTNNVSDTVSFTSDTAAKTQTSKRTVERNVEIGETLGELQDEIREAGIDDSLLG
jgi:hypothetical protein